jgi:hypothetical protein
MRRATRAQDNFGRTPESYDTAMNIKEQLTIGGSSKALSYMDLMKGDKTKEKKSLTTLTYEPFQGLPAEPSRPYSYTYADSGGWGTASESVRQSLDDLHGRCDAIIHQGAPTADELQAYIAQNYPVIFKGAAKDWTFRREWTKDLFLQKYGDKIVPIGNTIYPTFLYQTEEGVRMRDWIKSWGHPDFVPDALPSAFSTTFMGGIPQLKREGTLEGSQLLSKHHKPFFSHFTLVDLARAPHIIGIWLR